MEEKVKTFLDEGFDFIEESCSTTPLSFEETSKDIITESSEGVQRPYHILGVCKGVFQPINEPSRNFRMYDSDHWAYQLQKPEIQERLQNRRMLGQIGHRDARVDDLTISRGEISHVVTCMQIREDTNGTPYLYGELEILDTPAGRILKGLYEGGVGLYISSRGAGKLEDIPGQPLIEGHRMRRVSKTSFFLETWDIVANPGFLKARPVYESATLKPEKLSDTREDAIQESQTPTTVSESSEVSELKTQIEKLACVVEKVVDDMYKSEQVVSEEVQKQPIVEPKEEEKRETKELKCETKLTEESKAALISALLLLSELNVSEEALKEALDIMEDKLKG